MPGFCKYLIFLFCWVYSSLAWAELPGYKEFTINNGLPHTDAYCTVQDNKGFLWFATLDGLCRYDGFDMVVYRHDHADPNSISNNRITTLEFDNTRNGLWIGTQGGGVNYLDLVSGKFSKIELLPAGEPVKEVISLKIIGNNSLWIGTLKGLFVAHINNQNKVEKIAKIPLANRQVIETIYQDKNKGMWIGTLNELFYKAPGKGSFLPLHADKLQGVNAVVPYDETQVLIGSLNGMFSLNLGNFSLKKLNELKVVSLFVENPNTIWVGSFANGLFNCRADGSVEQQYLFGPVAETFKYKVQNIFKDRSSSIFVSTLGDGIKVINKNNYSFDLYPQEVTEEDFFKLKRPLCFYADNDSILYLGTRRNGLAIYNRRHNKVNFYQVGKNESKQLLNNDVSAVFKDADQNFWIGKSDGIYIIPKKNLLNNGNPDAFQYLANTYKPFRVNKIVQDKKQRVWVVTSKGLFCYNMGGQLIYNSKLLPKAYASLNTDFLNDIIIREEKGGLNLIIWLATKSGISRLKLDNHNLSEKELKKITAKAGENQLYSNWVSLLHEDQNHTIWAGTIGGGLSKLIPGHNGDYTCQTITTHDGLLTNDIETLLEDAEGNFWIGSIGLTKFNPRNKTFSYYDANDGLQSNAFKVWSAFKRPDGEMFFGGINGFNAFYPQNITKATQVFTPQLTNLIINNITVKTGSKIEGEVILERTLPYTSEITLNHKIRNFGLEFASIHSHDFQKIVYKYRLLGYDKQWTYTNSKKRFVNYTGLPPGDYTFELYASGGEGVWNTKPVTLQVHVIPSFWGSKYGYLLYALIILGGLFLQRRYTLIRLDIKHKVQLDKTRQEQEIKAYEDKMEFFTNISHELRTPLTLITTPAEQLVNYPGLPELVSNKLQTVHKNAERLRGLIDQILDIRKLEFGEIKLVKENTDISKFLSNLSSQFYDLAANKGIIISLDAQLNQHAFIDVFKMEQVWINLLSNAIKFTPANGIIGVKSYKEEDQIIISITNSGSLLSEEEQAKIFKPFYQVESKNKQGTGLGLTITKFLVELHDGTIGVNSWVENKTRISQTCFTIKLPVADEEALVLGATVMEARYKLPGSESNTKATQPALVIVDDNTELLEILTEEFQADYNVYTAENGKEGLKIIRKIKPVLIITDVMMPEVDGIEMCRAVKNSVAINEIPVIMLTAKSTDQSRLQGLEAMADDYIVKPFNLKELKQKVKNIVSQQEKFKSKVNNDAALKPAVLNFDSRDQRILKEIIEIIENNIEETEFTVDLLCQQAAMSRPALYRKIKELTGMSIQMFILDIRLKRAAQLINTKGFSISEAMYKSGFSSPSYFNKAFKKKYFVSPKNYNESIPV